jgi:hypothetical protein
MFISISEDMNMTKSNSTQKSSQSKNEVNEKAAPFEGERKKFATQMDAALLERLRGYAKSEGRQIQAVLEDAVESFLTEKQGYVMDPRVKAAHERSLKRYDKLYKALAK